MAGPLPRTRVSKRAPAKARKRRVRVLRGAFADRGCGYVLPPTGKRRGKEELMLLLILLALLVILAFGVGFTVHWLFIVAVVLAIVWLISLFAGASGGRSRGAWW